MPVPRDSVKLAMLPFKGGDNNEFKAFGQAAVISPGKVWEDTRGEELNAVAKDFVSKKKGDNH